MKKLLALVMVLALTGVTFGSPLSLVAPNAGDLGSMTNKAGAGDVIRVYVNSSVSLGTLDIAVSLDDGAAITAAMGVADCANYGWGADASIDPTISGSQALIAAANYSAVTTAGANIAYVDITMSGLTDEVVVSLELISNVMGGTFDGEWSEIPQGQAGSITLYQVPEPMTMSLLGLGGLALIRRRRA